MNETKKRRKSWQKTPTFLYIITGLVLIYLLLPVLIVIPMSFSSTEMLSFPPKGLSLRWYTKFFTESKWISAAMTSLKISIGTVVLSGTLGIVAALGLSKKIMSGNKVLKLVLMLPMMLPAVIVAVSMYMTYSGWELVGTFRGIILAHTCLAVPYVVNMVSAAMTGLDPSHYDAARSLGAGHWTAVRKVIIPLIKPAIFSSLLFAFVTSWDETVIVLFLSNSKTMTLPRLIYSELKYGISPIIAAVSSMLICITLFVFIVTRILGGMSPQARAARLNAKLEREQMKHERTLEKANAGV